MGHNVIVMSCENMKYIASPEIPTSLEMWIVIGSSKCCLFLMGWMVTISSRKDIYEYGCFPFLCKFSPNFFLRLCKVNHTKEYSHLIFVVILDIPTETLILLIDDLKALNWSPRIAMSDTLLFSVALIFHESHQCCVEWKRNHGDCPEYDRTNEGPLFCCHHSMKEVTRPFKNRFKDNLRTVSFISNVYIRYCTFVQRQREPVKVHHLSWGK